MTQQGGIPPDDGRSRDDVEISIPIPVELVRAIARQVREQVLAELQAAAPSEPSGYLAPQAAADYLGVSKKRIHDLTSMRAITPDGRDGRTPLYTRATLDAYVRSQARSSPPAR